MARRGINNGTNLVGAERDLSESIELWEQSKIAKTLNHHHNIELNFNPSHFGGVWERMIRMATNRLF